MGVEVSPGNVKEFAKYVRDLVEYWEPEAKKIKEAQDKPDENNSPEWGEGLQQAGQVKSKYDQLFSMGGGGASGTGGWVASIQALTDILNGLADACDKVAEDYASAEARNNADQEKIKNLLEREMAPEGQQGVPPTNTQV